MQTRQGVLHSLLAGAVPSGAAGPGRPPGTAPAEVAELVDAYDSGSYVREDVWVQVPPSAPEKDSSIVLNYGAYYIYETNSVEVPDCSSSAVSDKTSDFTLAVVILLLKSR